MTLEELQALLDEEKSKVSALTEQIKEKDTKIASLEKENSDFKLENTQLRTTNGKLLLRIDDAKKEETNETVETTKSLEESVLDILNKK